ncbi:MAG: IPT/TIG domain-containing protein [Chitinophagaceae bacterium]|nr:IPT/TIG domain-containing protein [Chitinophagaceae bacterium]
MADNTSTDMPVNEISKPGKFFAGLLLIIFTSLAIISLIAYWPNKMPSAQDGDDRAWYLHQRFNITLIEKADSACGCEKDSLTRATDSVINIIRKVNDSITTSRDSARIVNLKDSIKKMEATIRFMTKCNMALSEVKRIHLNTILLLLVALMGFLGNMIHVASSFTSYVGNGTFKRNWILWYFVKPFTAAGLAIIVYFIIRAGFLSYGTGASGISLYGILSLSALAGLFTDSATLKLKEVFEVIFKTKDDRTGKLKGDEVTVASNEFAGVTFTPKTIPAAGENTVVFTGKSLNIPDIIITIDGNPVSPASKTEDKIELKFTPAAAAVKAVFVFEDKTGKVLFTREIPVK